MPEYKTIITTAPDGTEDAVLCLLNAAGFAYRMKNLVGIDGKYTFSVWVRSDAETSVIFRIFGTEYQDTITTVWQRITHTVDTKDTFNVDIQPTDNQSIYLYKAQVETGTMATDWHPAPEDIEDTVNRISEGVDGLNNIVDGVVTISGGVIYANAEFVRKIFAQDIEATGKITGARLVGGSLQTTGDTDDVYLNIANGCMRGSYYDDMNDLTFHYTLGGEALNGIEFSASDGSSGAFGAGVCQSNGWEMPYVQCGSVAITPSAANTPTKKSITFPKAFPGTPYVFVTPLTAAPGTAVTGCSASGVSKSGCDIYLTRTGTTTTTVQWRAEYIPTT